MKEDDRFDDDKPVGRILSRREVLGLLGGFGAAAFLAACGDTPTATSLPAQATAGSTATTAAQAVATASGTALNAEAATVVAATPLAASPTADVAATVDCVVKPEMTAGPYFVDVDLNRSDIRTDTSSGTAVAGIPLAITFLVSQVAASACAPLPGAQVDIWHCDADGTYSGVQGSSGTNFLRGYQVTDANGAATFATIFPGWYSGRAVHIHFKIRATGADGNAYEFTSQFFFDEALVAQVFKQAPYSGKGQPDTTNGNDNIYRGGGDQTTLKLIQAGEGYTSGFSIALDLSGAQIDADDSAGGGGPGGPQ